MGSGAPWLHTVALGGMLGWLFSALIYPSCTITISVSRDAHASWATVLNARDCCQSGITISVSIDASRYLGMALIARVAYGRLPLFHYLLSDPR